MMGKWIDKMALWGLTALCALMMCLVMTKGNILLSASLAFLMVLTIRKLIGRMPPVRWVSRRERLRYARMVMEEICLDEEERARERVLALIPSLREAKERFFLLQRFPQSKPMEGNEVLDFWRGVRGQAMTGVVLAVTGPVDRGAFALAERLSNPSVRVVDGPAMEKMLIANKTLPDLPERLPRRKLPPLSHRLRRVARDIRPLRASWYALVFLALFFLTRRPAYLFTGSLFLLLLLARFFLRPEADGR